MLTCPKCFQQNVKPVGSTHYICTNPKCKRPDGTHTQFLVKQDDRVHFPYNQIFVGHAVHEFYRKPYLEIEDVGVVSTTR